MMLHRKISTLYLSALLILSFFYLSYRYPFQINSSTTSPTYVDTPFILLIAKYLIFSIILYFFVLSAFRVKESKSILFRSQGIELSLYLYVCVMSLIAMWLSRSDYMAQTGLFFSAVFLAYIIPMTDFNSRTISRVIHSFLYIAIIVDAYQIGNYYLTGRLPALGYEGSVNIRFGSVWDDPNGFALIIAFLLPFYWTARHKLISKVFVSFLLLMMLVLTLSLTGIASVCGSLFIGVLLLHIYSKNRNSALKLIFQAFVFTAVLYSGYELFLSKNTYFQLFLYEKQASIDLHLKYASNVKLEDILTLVSISPQGKFSESGYINMLINFGLIYFVAYVGIGLLTIRRFLRILKNAKDIEFKEIYYGAYFFVIAFFLGMSNIPYDVVFPLNLILVICILISYSISPHKQRTLND